MFSRKDQQFLLQRENEKTALQNYRKPKLLVFLNPHSGSALAPKIWKNVSQMLEKCGYEFKVKETLYPMHCHDYIKQQKAEQLLQYHAIVTVSGDGTIHEVLNAFMNHKQRDQLLQIPVGVINGGSGNALFATLADQSGEQCTPECSAFLIIKGQTRAIDVMEFEKQNSRAKIYSFLSLTWAYIADIDTGSEALRMLGPLRFQLYGLWRVIFLNQYEGRLTYSADKDAKLPDIKDAIAPNGDQWKIVEGRFTHFIAAKMPFVGEQQRMNPLVRLDDGYIDIQYILDDVSKVQFAKFLLNTDEGSFMDNQSGHVKEGFHLQYEKVRCLRLEPLVQEETSPRNNIMAIDGERYQPSAIQGTVLNKIFKVFCL